MSDRCTKNKKSPYSQGGRLLNMTRPSPRSPARQVQCARAFCPPPLSRGGPSFPRPFPIPCWPLIVVGGPSSFPSPSSAFLGYARLSRPLLCGAGLPCPRRSCRLCHRPCGSRSLSLPLFAVCPRRRLRSCHCRRPCCRCRLPGPVRPLFVLGVSCVKGCWGG